jgi:hypothetical protein
VGLFGPNLPIGKRTGLANPRGLWTDEPPSKLENPRDFVRRVAIKATSPRVVNPLKPLAAKPLGAFELAYAGKPVPRAGFTEALVLRQQTTQADRVARTRAAKPVALGVGKMSGWDWIRFGRRIRPADVGGVRGVVATVKPFADRGVHAQQLEMPIATTRKLASQAVAARVAVPYSESPEGTARVPMLTTTKEDFVPAAPRPSGVVYLGGESQSSSASWLYLAGALVLAWYVLRRA